VISPNCCTFAKQYHNRRRFFRQDEPPPEIERGSDTAPDEGTRP